MSVLESPPALGRASARRLNNGKCATTRSSAMDETTLREVRNALAEPKLGWDADLNQAVSKASSATGRVLGSVALRDMTLAARAELTGAGPLQYWLEQDGVTDVLVNSPNEAWIERRGRLERVAIDLHTQSGLRGLAVRLAALCGRRLDDAEPICDGALPDGTRFHAVLSPLAANAAVISLRVLRQDRFSLEELQRLQMFPPAWEPLLRNLVSQHANFLIAGGTGSGKTTLLAALLGIANPAQRLITVEEARELAPGLPHHVSLVARRSNVEGAGAVDLADLVRAALRMRPDRLVLGECRGAEVREVLQAMNTGHSGAMATIHANSAEGVPARLEALGALAGLTREAVKAQTFGAIDVVLHVVRENGIRRVAQIGVPVAVDGQLRVEVVATWAGGNNPIVATASWDQLWQRWSV